MNIRLEMMGELKGYFKSGVGGKTTLDIPEDANVETLLKRLGLSSEYEGVLLVNGQFASRDTQLNQDDQVQIIPLLEGG